MKRRRYVIGILLCVTVLLQAQDSVKSFDEFFVAGMDKIDGVFPVYVAEKEIYLTTRKIADMCFFHLKYALYKTGFESKL